MTVHITAPCIIAGPRANGRDFGILARSPDLPLRNGQIEHIATINHHMIDQVHRFPLVHFLMPIRGETGHWFLGTCRGQPPIAGNPVAITGGIVLHQDQLDEIGWRADLLVDARFDPEPVFAAWTDPEKRHTRIDPLAFSIDDEALAAPAAGNPFTQLAPVIHAMPGRMVLIDAEFDHTADGHRRALSRIGNLLSAAPFERAQELRWATATLPGPIPWDLATAAAAPAEQYIGVHIAGSRIELDGVNDERWQIETLWFELLGRARSFFATRNDVFSGDDVAAMLDDYRQHATIADRLVACLEYLRTDAGNSAGYEYWYAQLLVHFCASLDASASFPFFEAAKQLPSPSSATVRPLLEGGADAPLRRAGYNAETIARLAMPLDEPLALRPLLTAAEAAIFTPTETDIAKSNADCASLVFLAVRGGTDDSQFGNLLRSAATRDMQEAPAADDLGWIVANIPPLTADKRRSPEERYRIQRDCENLLDRIGPPFVQSDTFKKRCQRERIGHFYPAVGAEPDPLALRDFAIAWLRNAGAMATPYMGV